MAVFRNRKSKSKSSLITCQDNYKGICQLRDLNSLAPQKRECDNGEEVSNFNSNKQLVVGTESTVGIIVDITGLPSKEECPNTFLQNFYF